MWDYLTEICKCLITRRFIYKIIILHYKIKIKDIIQNLFYLVFKAFF